jgi:Protein of unknown function (DUF3343)
MEMKHYENTYGVVLFDTAHDAIIGEKLIRGHLSVALIPIPSQFSAGCGIVLRFNAEDNHRIEALLKEYKIAGRIEIVKGGKLDE